MVLIGLPGTLFYNLFYFAGATILPASQAFIVNYLWPIMSVVFACLILKEKVTVRKVVAFGVSFVGVMIISRSSITALDVNLLTGTVLCILGAAFYGAFTALNKKFRFDMTVSMMFSFFVSFLLSLAINLCMGVSWDMGAMEVLGFGWNGVFVMAAGSVLWATALNKGDTAKISNLAYVTPFLSLFWVFLFLHEPIAPTTLLGLAVIVMGILIQLKDQKSR